MSFELKEKIGNADAIMYFVNVEDIHSPEFISEISPKFRQDGEKLKERKPCEDDPTQVQIIDLLQMVLEIRKRRTNLGIIFSAWDLVDPSEQNDVRAFLVKRMNMLWQYLESNKKVVNTKIWGVSAIGGKIEDSEQLLDIEDQIKRIKIVDEKKTKSYDLTSIILEMSGDEYDS